MTSQNTDRAIIGSFDVVFAAMFGPLQHDQHIKARASHIEARALAERLRRADAAVRAECERMSTETARKLAATHHYDTASLRRMFDQYATGCFSKNWNASAQRRIALRALDIAIEFQGGAHAVAAE